MTRLVAGITLGAAALAFLSQQPSLAQNQNNQQPTFGQLLSPDLLQSMGVGSRSIAMGDAYTAIAADSSATFWNPARLPFITSREMMFEYRSVVLSRVRVDSNGTSVGASQGRPLMSFASILYPLHHNQGTLGFSYTLGGYFNYVRDSTVHDSNLGVLNHDIFDQTVRNQFFTLAYGHHVTKTIVKGGDEKDKSGKKPMVLDVGFGIGGYYINSQSKRHSFSEVFDTTNNNSLLSTTETKESDVGDGTGIILGLTLQPGEKKDALSPFTLGFTHRTGTHLDGLTGSGTSFGTAIPARTSLGMAYSSHAPGDSSQTIIVSLEGQLFSGANTPQQTDYRQEETNVHFGIEWGRPATAFFGRAKSRKTADGKIEHGRSIVPERDTIFLRAGFRTNQNAAKNYTYYDNVASVGLGYVRNDSNDKPTLILEPTAEVFTKTGLVQWTFTGRVRW